jgi:hypothetical protein
VRGFLNGGSCEAIPLEVNAYTLEGHFEQNPAGQFSVASVADEVRSFPLKSNPVQMDQRRPPDLANVRLPPRTDSVGRLQRGPNSDDAIPARRSDNGAT